MKILRVALCGFFLALAGLALDGCATDDPNNNNVSKTPWNPPMDTSPSYINQGR